MHCFLLTFLSFLCDFYFFQDLLLSLITEIEIHPLTNFFFFQNLFEFNLGSLRENSSACLKLEAFQRFLTWHISKGAIDLKMWWKKSHADTRQANQTWRTVKINSILLWYFARRLIFMFKGLQCNFWHRYIWYIILDKEVMRVSIVNWWKVNAWYHNLSYPFTFLVWIMQIVCYYGCLYMEWQVYSYMYASTCRHLKNTQVNFSLLICVFQKKFGKGYSIINIVYLIASHCSWIYMKKQFYTQFNQILL